MKIVTVVGARPQFIKAAAVSNIIREKISEVLIHTGQHYDENMSRVFFDELCIPEPDYNLSVGSGTHGVQTAEMLMKIEEILMIQKPDALMVYGDTNSTLAAALAASKLNIPIIHIEAGPRTRIKNMPEEQNRIIVDHLSTILFCPTFSSIENLKFEGITENVYNVGDVMCDAVLHFSKISERKSKDSHFLSIEPIFNRIENLESWYLATIHRAENTDSVKKIQEILLGLNRLSHKVIFPVHPRTLPLIREVLNRFDLANIYFIKPLGYIDMLYFTKNAVKVVTDSGGLQKEAYILKTPCITVGNNKGWLETFDGNLNVISLIKSDDIVDKVENTKIDWSKHEDHFGNGNSAIKILDILESFDFCTIDNA